MKLSSICFLRPSRTLPLSNHDLKVVSKGIDINGPSIFNIQMLILPWLFAFFVLKFLTIFEQLFKLMYLYRMLQFITPKKKKNNVQEWGCHLDNPIAFFMRFLNSFFILLDSKNTDHVFKDFLNNPKAF